MFRLGLFWTFLVAVGAIRFHEFTAGQKHFHGIPIEKYVTLMNRIREISWMLEGITEPVPRLEEIDWENDVEKNPRENPFLFEGDIVLTEEQLDGLVQSYEHQLAIKEGRRFNRLFSIGNPAGLWKNFPIPWRTSPKYPPAGGAEIIRTGVQAWEDNTCVTFQENGTATDGIIVFYGGSGCSSPMGKSGSQNPISLANGCQYTYTVAHEIGHSLGLFHTQTRFDRNQYIDVLTANINPNKTHNFNYPDPYWQATYRGIPYDMGSVMHYPRYGFGLKYDDETILPIDRNFNTTIGQHFELAFTDVKEVNLMYCDHVCSNKLPCQNGGYTDPKDCTKCRCPEGLAGTHCERVASYSPVDCGVSTNLKATPYGQTLRASGGKSAVYKITAPEGHRLHIRLDSATFSGTGSFDACQSGFVEIKYGSQYETAGARFCDEQLPKARDMFSARNEALVIYKPEEESHAFSLRYRYF